ncbi:MAG: hypothetical protein WCI18_00205 [Pseudomonadota bacterium]
MSLTVKNKIARFISSAQFSDGKRVTLEITLDREPFAATELPRGLSYLPVEWLKSEPSTWFRGKEIAKTFLSSGTESTRSKSHFSKDGLIAYKVSALQGLLDFMEQESLNFQKIVSFVPDTFTWPDSSLAQMIAWFGEFFPLKYLDSQNVEQVASAFQEDTGATLYVGTAFHWINLIDDGLKVAFPKSGYLLETGGTKGKSRNLTRAEFYQLLRTSLHVNSNQILSEYGMSELSSQAWSKGDETASYRFSSWVDLAVVQGKELSCLGEGSLLIKDPSRMDYPYSFRVQDVASLNQRDFHLLGRVPSSALKGCSLLAEQPPAVTSLHKPLKIIPHGDGLSFEALNDAFKSLLESPLFTGALEKEFYSSDLALSAILDLKLSFYGNPEDLSNAIKNSGLSTPQLTIVPPSTHSLAILHPLTLALAQGAAINIRVPEAFEGENSSLKILIRHFSNLFPGRIHTLSRKLKLIGSQEETLVFFGSDVSLNEIKSFYNGEISAFGSAAAVSIVGNLENLGLAIKDALSLAGKGCMSSRAIYLIETNQNDLNKELEKIIPLLPKINLSLFDRCALDHEETDLLQNEIPYLTRKLKNDILFYFPNSLSTPFSTRLFSIPIFKIKASNLKDFIGNLGTSVFLSTDIDLETSNSGLVKRPLGALNISPFDGYHQNRALFASSN